jgi:hypothetical protein
MAYLGNTPTQQGFIPAIDFFSGNGSTTAFTLSRPVASVAQVQATIENVPQNPGTAFTVSGNTITFDGAPASGTNNIYVYYTSPITQVIQPGQGTVGTAQLASGVLTPTAVSDQLNASTGYFDLPTGTTAQRPASPIAGMIRYNTTLARFEYYNGSVWAIVDADSTSTQYLITYTVVGGAGGGGIGNTSGYAGGGGGAGGVNQGAFLATSGTVYTTTLGAGGNGNSSGGTSYAGNGSTSTISGSGLINIDGFGGGRGGNNLNTSDCWGAGAGGSGGGGGSGSNTVSNLSFFGVIGGAGTNGQGTSGGYGMYFGAPDFVSGGGGGGAQRPGGSALVGNGPVGVQAGGGSGIPSIVNGTTYGGGGGGGYGQYNVSGGSGGAGGGGAGGGSSTSAVAGTANTGGGGGGGGGASGRTSGANGGSGIILISMPTSRYTGTTTGSPSVSTSGSNTILTFTSSGTYTA